MLIFEVNKVKFKLTGTRFFEYECEETTKQIWYCDIKNLSNNKTKVNVNYDKIKKYID
jgi:hypothetical protein